MKQFFKIVCMLGLLLAGLQSSGQTVRRFVPETFVSDAGDTLMYRVLYPVDYDSSEQYPLLLFLHGAGERGSDNAAQLKHGGRQMLASKDLESVIVIAPQCPDGYTWAPRLDNSWGRFPYDSEPTVPGKCVKQLLERFIGSGTVDVRHVYCTGLSMGGMGTLDFACRYPDMFAAVTPICGGVNLMRLAEFPGRTAFRFFHGSADPTVPVECSRYAVDVLKAGRYPVEYTEYPGVRHNSWDNAFAEPDFFPWFFRH